VLLREQMAAIQRSSAKATARHPKSGADRGHRQGHMPQEVETGAKELRRLERMPEAAAEYGMIRTYLDWLIELPWALPEEQPIDISDARRILDEDHYGLDKIKRRSLNTWRCASSPRTARRRSCALSDRRAWARPRSASRSRAQWIASSCACRSAACMTRPRFVAIAGPISGRCRGNIIQAIRKAGTRNCVMMLDEIDKLGAGIQGDPSAALLEVLDPEQNNTFRDNYLGVPFDLSRVVFITTANLLDTIPGPLRDRMEIITLAGYTENEKLEIAKRYLLRRQLEANGLNADQVEIEEAALRAIISGYTREAGVRNLEREIGKVLRHAAVRIAEGSAEKVHIGADDLPEVLGQPRFENEVHCAPLSPEWPPDWLGLPLGAISYSSKPRGRPATAS
jgi:ATP-dependent Lon protease